MRPVWAGHPWVFAQAVKTLRGAPAPGDAVRVLDEGGRFLGSGFWSPESALVVRIASHVDGEHLDAGWLARRIDAAAALRHTLGFLSATDTGYRLINAEGDALPGLIVDVRRHRHRAVRHHRHAAPGAGRVRPRGARPAPSAWWRRPPTARPKKASRRRSRWCAARARTRCASWSADSPWRCPPASPRRRATTSTSASSAPAWRPCPRGATCWTRSRSSARSGSRRPAAGPARCSAWTARWPPPRPGVAITHRLGFADRHEFLTRDAKQALPELQQSGRRFDMVIVDPPKLVPSARHLERGREAYRKLNQNALRLVSPGGLLVSCSCSAAMQAEDFLRTISIAA
ncbi:MAG: hypothetical protein IPG17_33205 [Sandaracinaceae bacterium]|nr:hypothetical protein [Sandaracinaceae bacterium]